MSGAKLLHICRTGLSILSHGRFTLLNQSYKIRQFGTPERRTGLKPVLLCCAVERVYLFLAMSVLLC